MDIVPISYVQYKKPVMQTNSVCKYTESGRSKIHAGLECMNYETIKNIVKNPFELETVELNDVIISKCASQCGKCYISEIEISIINLGYIYKSDKIKDKKSYQNITIVDKNIKELLLWYYGLKRNLKRNLIC